LRAAAFFSLSKLAGVLVMCLVSPNYKVYQCSMFTRRVALDRSFSA
jgi:hypothetical protein